MMLEHVSYLYSWTVAQDADSTVILQMLCDFAISDIKNDQVVEESSQMLVMQ